MQILVMFNPVKRQLMGNRYTLFNDEEIRHKLEDYHILKGVSSANCMDDSAVKLQESVNEMVLRAKAGGGSNLMNAYISDQEVKLTFGKGSDTPGPDGISAKLLDKADRDRMHTCLQML